MSAKLPAAIVRAASSKIGVHEEGGNNKGKDLAPFFAADSYDPNGAKPGDDGYAWCAAFCCWVVKAAMQATGTKETPGFRRPTTPAAYGFEDWSLAQDASTHTKRKPRGDLQAGDLVTFTFSHIGVVTKPPGRDGWFETIEGNTDDAGSREGGGVFVKRRHIDQVRARVRFMI